MAKFSVRFDLNNEKESDKSKVTITLDNLEDNMDLFLQQIDEDNSQEECSDYE